MSVCQFTSEYFDYENKKQLPFKCLEKALDTGCCIFHDETQYTKHKEEVSQYFIEKVKKAIANDEILYCIGYNIPEVCNLQRLIFLDLFISRKPGSMVRFISQMLTFT